ncbi:hypothetical protein WICMUC_005233 [Wickerhamomyces mucosus]|uniref:Rhodanese domain-containing protein n=1 Tax=Wickerhamomyces mucosus TaxID=1378264 RepID=A0A9P8T687_9ASCO|nr:hypothetical protein WICMUC_005233 [Wickerhamomyces mucosus]
MFRIVSKSSLPILSSRCISKNLIKSSLSTNLYQQSLSLSLSYKFINQFQSRFNSTKVNNNEINSTESTTESTESIQRSKEPIITQYNYEDIKKLISNPSPSQTLIDVREPNEYLEGHIKGAINIPYKSTPGALDLSDEEFEDIFKFTKPSKNNELIFYCLAGVRSTASLELASMFGYTKLGNYLGSYEDWVLNEEKNGEIQPKN